MAGREMNTRQREVLKWIGDGCPPGVMTDTTYKTTAMALQNRRLAKVSKRRGAWTATLTPAGRHYLDHNAYPEGHWDVPERDATPGQIAAAQRRQSGARVTGIRPVDQLLADVAQASGRLVVTEGHRGYWENLVSTATRHNKVPAGKILTVERGTAWNEHVITLTDAPTWMNAQLTPVPVDDRLRRPDPAVTAIKNDSAAMSVSRKSRVRALRLLDALAKEARRRGYPVRNPRPESGHSRSNGLLEIEIVGSALVVNIEELSDRVPHEATAKELKEKERYSWTRIPTHDLIPSGRLRLSILTGWPIRQNKFADTKTINLADRLPAVLQELELRAAAFEERRLERAREETARRQRWEQAVADAKTAALEHHRAEVLLRQVDRWLQCRDIDAYLEAAADHITRQSDEERDRATEWMEWARNYRARIHPFAADLRMPPDPSFTAETLKPFMGGLSPYGP